MPQITDLPSAASSEEEQPFGTANTGRLSLTKLVPGVEVFRVRMYCVRDDGRRKERDRIDRHPATSSRPAGLPTH